jgi:hypothetical protein
MSKNEILIDSKATPFGFLILFGSEPLKGMVGLTGLEPVTLRLSSACSNQLSYRPVAGLARTLLTEVTLAGGRR